MATALPALAAPPHVLLVSGDDPRRRALATALMQDPRLHFGGAAADLAPALALLGRSPAELLLCDRWLPGGDGLALLRGLREAALPTRCVFLLERDDGADLLSALAAGADGALLWQDGPAALLQQLPAVAAGGCALSPRLARHLVERWRQAAPTPAAALLSQREVQVLRGSARGRSHDEIAAELGVSAHTVITYVKRSYRKLHVASKSQALLRAQRLGLLDD